MWIRLYVLAVCSVACFCAPGERSFTPSYLSLPIEKIVLSTDMTFGEPAGDIMILHECLSGDCMVDVTREFPILHERSLNEIKDGTYPYLTVTSCSGEQDTFNATLRGNVTFEDGIYYSHTAYGLAKRLAGEPEQNVTVTFKDCNFYYELHEPFVVEDSEVLPLTLFIDLDYIAWGKKSIQGVQSGCYEGNKDGTAYSVCVGYPHMVPVMRFDSPKKLIYHIHPSDQPVNTASGLIVLYVDTNNMANVLGGFSRRLFSSDSLSFNGASFDMSIRKMTLNSNGTYQLSTFGRFFETSQLVFPEFSLTPQSSGEFIGGDGIKHQYKATLIE